MVAITAVFRMYVTLMPVILTGILNMIWLKLPVLSNLSRPLDHGVILWDHRRLFGDNKTYKGIVGYVVLALFTTVLWGWFCYRVPTLYQNNFFYINYPCSLSYNLLIGLLLGLAYSVSELPNSFLKRRLDIKEGEAPTGLIKWFFVFMDQADSLFGCVWILSWFYSMSLPFYLVYVFLGAITHLVVNVLLYFGGLRKNMF